jgi:hypothetical protein
MNAGELVKPSIRAAVDEPDTLTNRNVRAVDVPSGTSVNGSTGRLTKANIRTAVDRMGAFTDLSLAATPNVAFRKARQEPMSAAGIRRRKSSIIPRSEWKAMERRSQCR